MGSKSKQPAARLGDIDTGHPPAPPTPIITASGNVFINGIPAARKGDMLAPHHPGVRIITEGSSSVKINGMPAARITDAINCGGKIIVGSGNVLIGDSPPSGSPLAPGEWDDYIAASSTAQNLSPVQDQQMRADIAVKYRGKAAATSSWKSYYSDMSPKDRPAPSNIQNPAQRSGLEQANSAPASPAPTLPGPAQQQTIDSAGQQMVQAIKNLAEGEMVTPEMLSLASTMLQSGGAQSKSIDKPAGSVGAGAADGFASSILKNAGAAEVKVTNALQNIVKNIGGKLEGLDYRLKLQDSLVRKIATDAEIQEIPLSEAAQNINDALRYTAIIDPVSFGDNILRAFDKLETAGYTKVAVKNTFTRGSVYKGVNTTFRTESGQNFELQFHTSGSFNIKQNINHVLYEELRLPSTPVQRQKELIKTMKMNSDKIGDMQNIDLVKNFRLGD